MGLQVPPPPYGHGGYIVRPASKVTCAHCRRQRPNSEIDEPCQGCGSHEIVPLPPRPWEKVEGNGS